MPSNRLPRLQGMDAVHVRRCSTGSSRAAFLAAMLASTCLFAGAAQATDSTWVGGNGGDPNEWVEPNNWSGAAQPDNIATFDNTATTNSVLNDNGVVFINQITFAATASTFAIGVDNPFLIQGTGIVNFSGTLQAFTVADTLIFQNSATVLGGNVTINDNNFVNFQNSSNAGSANIVNTSNLEFDATSSAGAATISSSGLTTFFNSADAGNASITNSGELDFLETSSAASSNIVNTGTVNFTNSGTAASATIDNQAGGTLDFHNSATAANASITNESGATLTFNDSATAGNANINNSIGGGGDIEFTNASSAANSSIVNDGTVNFHGTSTAANAVITGSIGGAGTITFDDSTTADHASINFNGSTSAFTFNNNSTAANATITMVSGTISSFNDSASAGNAAITFGAGAFLTGILEFHGSSTAQNATITLTSPSNLGFFDSSSGGNARIISQSISNNIDISSLTTSGTTFGSIEGTGQLELGSKQLTVGGNNLSTAFAGVIQDGGGGGGVGGSLAKTGTGTFTLSGANTYTGFTDVLQGTVQAGAANTFSAASDVVISAGATLDLNGFSQTIASLSGSGFVTLGAGSTLTTNGDNAVTTYSGVISGNGGLTKVGTNPLTLTGANTYSGFTNVNAGTLRAGAANAFSATSDVVVAGGATLDLNNINQTIASLSGAGNVTLGSATLTTNGLNASTTFSGVISGAGGLTKVGTGTLALSGNNTYTGPTTINAGTLRMGVANALTNSTDVTVASGATFDLNNFNQTIGSLSGAGNVTLGSATLSTNADNAPTTFSGAISGSGGLTKIGTGTLILTGTSTYNGPTSIQIGTLDVNGSIANSTVTVGSGATLKGNGTVGGVVAGNGSTVMPGNSIGTLHVAGNVSFGPGSTYQVEANAAGQSDLIIAGGNATLTGGVVQVLAASGNYAPSTVYPIITTGGTVTGTFAGVTVNQPFLIPSLSYKANEVDLTLSLLSLTPNAQTPNQLAVATAIQSSSSALYLAILALPTPGAIRGALDATSGEIHASMHSVMLESGDTLRQGVLEHLHDREHKTGGGLWGRLFGSWGAVGSDGNAATLNTNYSGVTVGMDAPVSDDFLLGGAGGYGQLEGFIGQTRGSSLVSDTFHAELYASFTDGPFSLNGAAIGSLGTLRTDRAVRFTGFSDRDTAKQYGRTTQLFAEAAWDCPLGDFDVQPFLNGGWVEAYTGAFREAGGIAALSGTKGSSDETFMTLGTRLATDVTLANGGIITPNATLGWLHAFRNLTPQRFLTFEATSASFTVAGVPLDEDQAVIDLAISAQPVRGLTASVGYDGILSGHVRDNGLHASLMWAF